MRGSILAGDIGGTNARFVLWNDRRSDRQILESRRFPDAAEAILHFLAGRKPPRFACIGIAGPVIRGRSVATNLPWVIDERVIAKKTGIENVRLVNDLVSVAFGALFSAPRMKTPLWGSKRPPKNASVAVLAPGTGLGECALLWDGEKHMPLPTEGGHADFAAQSELEWELYLFARNKLNVVHVSYERFLSGPGIGLLYDFFREKKRVKERDDVSARIEDASDRNAAITQLGVSGESPAARQALELFATIYGAEAGNLVLKTLASGVLLCGNITNNLLPFLEKSRFHAAFLDKGRLSHVVEDVPVAVALGKELGLAGSHMIARAMVSARPPRVVRSRKRK